MFIPCTPSVKSCWLGHKLRWVQVIGFVPTLRRRMIWGDVYGGKTNPLDTKTYRYRFWHRELPYLGKHLMYVNKKKINYVKYIMAESINCTSDSCEILLLNSFRYGKLLSSSQHFSPHGIQMVGYRFSTIINKRSHQKESEDINAFRLLSPFGLIGWLALLVSGFCLGSILMMTGVNENPYYWLYASLLEQESDKREWLNWHNSHLIIWWLYACHLIRNQYTSSMYDYMTHEREPCEIPVTFNQLIYNSSIRLLTSFEALPKLSLVKDSILSKNRIVTELLKKTSQKTWHYGDLAKDILEISISGYKQRYFCETSLEAFKLIEIVSDAKNVMDDLNKNKVANRITRSSPICSILNRFAWVYSTNSITDQRNSENRWLYSKFLMILFGNFFLIENNDPAVFSEIHGWQFSTLTYLAEMARKRTGAITESGIFAYQNHFAEIIFLRQVLDKFRNVSGFNQSWNWYSLVNQMVSKYTPLALYSSASYRLSVSLAKSYGKEGNGLEMTGTMYDFRYIWIFDGSFKIILVCVFFIEIVWHKVSRCHFVGFERRFIKLETRLYQLAIHKITQIAALSVSNTN